LYAVSATAYIFPTRLRMSPQITHRIATRPDLRQFISLEVSIGDMSVSAIFTRRFPGQRYLKSAIRNNWPAAQAEFHFAARNSRLYIAGTTFQKKPHQR
jgi:hypothetical protein